MKRIMIITASAIAAGVLWGSSANAVLSLNNPGLPQGWTLADIKGYGLYNNVLGNPASAMCVECHTVNPSDRIPAPSNINARVYLTPPGGGGGFPDGATVLASHYVSNKSAQAAQTDPTWSHSGGGFLDGFTSYREGGEYLPGDPVSWAGGARAKFRDESNTTTLITINHDVPPYQDVNAGMICESCHSLLANVGNSLIRDTYSDNGDSTICIRCHNGAQSAVPVLTEFHNNDNLPIFGQTANRRKRHHVLTGDVLIVEQEGVNGVTDDNIHYDGVSSTDGRMWAPLATNAFGTGWCGSGAFGNTRGAALDLTMANPNPIEFRNTCNISGQGTRLFSDVQNYQSVTSTSGEGGDIRPANASSVTCANCHRPHNAMTGSGAFILRTGGGSDFGGVGFGYFAGVNTSDPTYYIRRQVDMGAFSGQKIYKEYTPLCVGCHQGYAD